MYVAIVFLLPATMRLAAYNWLGFAVFITANVSGGHLNPAVTLATMVTGHISIPRGLTYMLCQICGAAFGILIVVSKLMPVLSK